MNCSKCGSKLNEGEKFCKVCGNKIIDLNNCSYDNNQNYTSNEFNKIISTKKILQKTIIGYCSILFSLSLVLGILIMAVGPLILPNALIFTITVLILRLLIPYLSIQYLLHTKAFKKTKLSINENNISELKSKLFKYLIIIHVIILLLDGIAIIPVLTFINSILAIKYLQKKFETIAKKEIVY